jgi:hypothetical protein
VDLSSRKAGGNDVFEGQAVEYKMVSKQEQDISGQSEGSALNFAQPIMDEAVIPGVCQGHNQRELSWLIERSEMQAPRTSASRCGLRLQSFLKSAMIRTIL